MPRPHGGAVKRYTALLITGVVAIAAIGAIVAVDIGRLAIPPKDHDLRVDPLIDRQNLFTTARVTVQNTGARDLTGVTVNFGGGDKLVIGDLAAGDQMIVSPPAGNPMEMVAVTADGGLLAVGEYREPPKMVGMMGS